MGVVGLGGDPARQRATPTLEVRSASPGDRLFFPPTLPSWSLAPPPPSFGSAFSRLFAPPELIGCGQAPSPPFPRLLRS